MISSPALRALAVMLCLVTSTGIQSAADEAAATQTRAIARLDEYIDHFRKTGDRASLLSELAAADGEFERSNILLAARTDWPRLALGLIKRGTVHRLQAQWQPAIQFYTQAVQAAVRAGNASLQSDALAWRALAESSRNNMGQALADADEAVRLGDSGGDPDATARALDVLGSAHLAQRNLAAAAAAFNREIDLAQHVKDPTTAYYAHLGRSDVYLKSAEKCDYERSFQPCYDALERSQNDLDDARRVALRLGFAALANQADQFSANIKTRRALIESNQRMDQSIAASPAFHPRSLANVLVTDHFVPPHRMVPPALEQAYRSSLQQEQQAAGFADASRARGSYLAGLVAEMNGNNDAALAAYLQAADRLDRDRRSLRDEKGRGTFIEDDIGFYYAAALQLLERRRYDDAFLMLERSRSRALADLLGSRSIVLDNPKERQLYADAAQIRSRISDAQSRLFELTSKAGTAGDGGKRVDLQKTIDALESQDRALAARLAAETPHLHDLVRSEPAGLPALQTSMRTRHYEMLQYLVLETGVVVWHITAQSVVAHNVFLPRSALLAKVGGLQKSLADRNVPFDQVAARELFLYLIAPVLPRLQGKRLVIVAQEDLQSVPFQVLQDPDTQAFLGERFQITYAPSASILLKLPAPSGLSGGRLLAVADPGITAAPAEVAGIARSFMDRQKVVTDTLPPKKDVMQWMRQYDVIHLSVHGRYVANEPMLSYLAFSGGADDDGRLTAAEMFGLPLANSRLVVLSACESGRAEATHANEVLGIVRGLLYAGAGTLVLSQWKVDSDATAVWMGAFYQAAQANPLPEAARLALLKVKAMPQFSHPYYWAAFTMVGA